MASLKDSTVTNLTVTESLMYNDENMLDVILNNAKDLVYSTEEEDTGQTWIAGQKIYRKVIATSVSCSNNTTITHGITDAKYIWIDNSHSFMYGAAGYSFPLAFYQYSNGADAVTFAIDRTNIVCYCATSWGTGWVKVFTILYIKNE